jgi:alpha-tubulin suppressor-like RCC1 family protein
MYATRVTQTALAAGTAIGGVRATGSNWSGELDNPQAGNQVNVPVGSNTEGTAIAAGDSHNLVLQPGGLVRAWGSNDHGQRGTSDPTSYSNLVWTLPPAVAIAAGVAHSLALDAFGHVWA